MAAEVDKPSFWEFKGSDEYNDSLFMMRCPFPMLIFLGAYLLFVLKIGPLYMKNKPPFKLRRVIIGYNALQVLYSIYMAKIGIEAILELGLIERGTCFTEYGIELRQRLARGHHLYFIAKFTEFLDTIFFVLRKKWSHISFLHVYHHGIMYFSAWLTLKYEPTYSLVFLGTVNSIVHAIMYTYYALSAFPRLQKYLWWKKYITKMQLIQFLMVLIQIIVNSYTSTCPLSHILLPITLFHGVLFIYLFTDFYIKSYKNKKPNTSIAESKAEETIKSQ